MAGEKKGLFFYLKDAWLVLAISVVFGGGLALSTAMTREQIAENKRQAQQGKLAELFGEGIEIARVVELDVTVRGQNRQAKVYEVVRGGQRAGWGIVADGKGYDKLTLMIGLSADAGTLVGYRVVSSAETAGVGDVIATSDYAGQFAGRKATEPLSPVAAERAVALSGRALQGQKVYTITGATMSTRNGVVKTINEYLKQLQPRLAAGLPEAKITKGTE